MILLYRSSVGCRGVASAWSLGGMRDPARALADHAPERAAIFRVALAQTAVAIDARQIVVAARSIPAAEVGADVAAALAEAPRA